MCLQVADIRGKEAAAAETPAAGDAPQLDFAQPEPENVDEVCAIPYVHLLPCFSSYPRPATTPDMDSGRMH